jgi:hypothetical protein
MRMPHQPVLARSAACAALCLPLAAGGAWTGFIARPQPEQPIPVPRPEADPPALPADPERDPLDDEPAQVRVYLKSGAQVTGSLVEQTERGVVVSIGGITMAIDFAEIDRVDTLPSLLQRYKEMRAAIPERDTDQLLLLSQWLISVGKYQWALKELDVILAIRPEDTEAARLRRVAQSQLELQERAAPRADRPRDGAEARAREPEFPLLSAEEANLIKVFEVDLDHPPRMLVDHKTIEDLMVAYADSPLIPATREGREALLRKRPDQILELMFRLKAREFYGRVTVLDWPPALRKFRESVHQTWLVNSCATDRCHGGREAGRLWLSNRRPNSETTIFTNFLILERFRTADGEPLIDYQDPMRSRVLHAGLPREDSVFPHPAVPGPDGLGDAFKPVFRSTDDRRFEQALEWIRGMYLPRPDYPIAYIPPVPPGTTPPAPLSNGANPPR